MFSRLTAEAPLAEPDSANYKNFYSTDGDNYGSANEVDYGSNAIKILWLSNIYYNFPSPLAIPLTQEKKVLEIIMGSAVLLQIQPGVNIMMFLVL